MKVVKTKNDYILRTIVGEKILVPVGEAVLSFNGIITLNDTGAFLWECLSSGVPVSELLEKLVNEFEVETEQAEQDIQDFMNDASRCGLIEVITE